MITIFLAFSAFLFVYCFVWMESSQLKSIRVIPAKVTPKAVNDGSLITLKFSPFVTINEIISWKFHLHTCYQSIFAATWNFWLFHKSCQIWVWANFTGQFLENWILSFQPQFSIKFTRKCARISQNYFLNFWNQKKYFIWNIESVKIGGPLEIFQNIGPWNSRIAWF